jgi:hypothetical protein
MIPVAIPSSLAVSFRMTFAAATPSPVLGDSLSSATLSCSDSKSRQKSNLLIFITPTIVQDDDYQPTKSDFLKTPSRIPSNPTGLPGIPASLSIGASPCMIKIILGAIVTDEIIFDTTDLFNVDL